jgi:D-alanyl-D-alanine carboxypeptidase
MAYAGPKETRPRGQVVAYRRNPLSGQVVLSALGGVMFLIGALLLTASFLSRGAAAPATGLAAEERSIPTPAGTVAGASSAVAVSQSQVPSTRSQQGGVAEAFAMPPPELTSAGWLQNFRPTHLWSSAGGEGADLGELAQWTYVQYSGESENGRTRVMDPGDGVKRPTRSGWLNSDDLGPTGTPPVEWYMGVGESERRLSGAPQRITNEWPTQISGQGAVIMDAQTGAVLFGKNARRHMAMASCTKMVTAILALERGHLNDEVKVDVDGTRMAIEMESTVMGLQPGETVTLETLLYGLMLPSGNDAAVAIAKHIAGSEPAFVDLMNAKVRELGLEDTHFVNPHGLDAQGHYSSPYDQASIARYGMTNPVFARIVGAKEYSGEGYQLRNANRLLWNYPGADGVKPGFTDDAGSALVASATRDGHRVITTVIKANSAAMDSAPLLDWAFKSFSWS